MERSWCEIEKKFSELYEKVDQAKDMTTIRVAMRDIVDELWRLESEHRSVSAERVTVGLSSIVSPELLGSKTSRRKRAVIEGTGGLKRNS